MVAPEKSLALKALDGAEETELTEEQVVFITKDFYKCFKKNNETSRKKHSNGNPTGCYKCGKTDHQIWIILFGKSNGEKKELRRN